MFKKVVLWIGAAAAIICIFNIIVLTAMRPVWVYINQSVPVPLISATLVLFIVNTAVLAASLVFPLSYAKKPGAKDIKPPVYRSILFLTFGCALLAVTAYMLLEMGSNKQIVFDKLLFYLSRAADFIPLAAIALLLTAYPGCKLSRSRLFKIISVLLVVTVMIFYIGDFRRVRITCGPFVQALDGSNMAVIWATNLKSTAYVEYGSDANSLRKVMASEHGLIEANSTIHKVVLPAGGLERFVYRVGSTRIKKLEEGRAVFGNTTVSGLKTIENYSEKDNISFYVLNDVHGRENIYKKFLSGKDYDFFVLNGDTIDNEESPLSFFKQVIQPANRYTGGSKPLHFNRGNHETRGGFARELPNSLYLPGGNYYYYFEAGPVFAIMLDSGNGNDILDKKEINYGLVSMKQYRDKQTQWLKAVCESKAYKKAAYRIAFVHAPLNSYLGTDLASNNTYEAQWRELLNITGADAVFSGHTHVPEIIKPDLGNFNFPTFVGGGEKADYIAIKTEVRPAELKVFFEKLDGSKQMVYSIKK